MEGLFNSVPQRPLFSSMNSGSFYQFSFMIVPLRTLELVVNVGFVISFLPFLTALHALILNLGIITFPPFNKFKLCEYHIFTIIFTSMPGRLLSSPVIRPHRKQ